MENCLWFTKPEGKQVASVAVDIRTLSIGSFRSLPITFLVLSNKRLEESFSDKNLKVVYLRKRKDLNVNL